MRDLRSSMVTRLAAGMVAVMLIVTSAGAGAGAAAGAAAAPAVPVPVPVSAPVRATADRLSVVLSSPSGALDSVEQGSEIRWLFDRPVVALSAAGAGPQSDPASFVKISPATPGTFRWASTRALVFTPSATLPRSTRITATLTGLGAVDGTTLAAPSVMRFETPRTACQLHGTDAAWPTGGHGSQVVVFCDQGVEGAQLAALSTMTFSSLTVEPASFTPSDGDLAAMQKADPAGAKRLAAKLAGLSRPSRRLGQSAMRLARTARCGPDRPVCHWLELTGAVPIDAVGQLRVAAGLTSAEGPLPGPAHTVGDAISTPASPFVLTTGCRVDCDPEAPVAISISDDSISAVAFDRKLRVRDLQTGRVRLFVADRPETRVVEQRDADTGETVLVEETGEIDPLRANPLRLLWAGLQPGHGYSIEIDPAVATDRGQALGYRSITTFSLGNYSAFISLPSGERVLERGKAAGLRVRSRNVARIEQARRKVSRGDLVRTVLEFGAHANGETDENGQLRPLKLNGFERAPIFLAVKANQRSSVPIPVAANAKADRGVYVIAMRPIAYQPKSRYDGEGFPLPAKKQRRSTSGDPRRDWSTTLVQLTDLAVTIKQSPGNVLVGVTSLTNGQSAGGATVDLYAGGKRYWSGKTDGDGLAWAPPDPRRACGTCNLVVVAQHKGDLAYAQSRWRDGYDAYDGDESIDGAGLSSERFVASMFADRGVYKVGEQVHVKGLLRVDTEKGLRLPDFSEVTITVTDARDVDVYKARLKVTKQGGFESLFRVPADGAQGSYRVEVETPSKVRVGSAAFLVATFRRPEFKVDVAPAPGRQAIRRGETFDATVEGRYLFGASMQDRDVSWTLRASATGFDPSAGQPELGLDGYSWQYYCHNSEDCFYDQFAEVASGDGVLNADGQLKVTQTVKPDKLRHKAQQYQLEAVVTDVNRQAIANRTSVLVHPGDFYTGVKLDDSFVATGQAMNGRAVTLSPAGVPVPGAALSVRLTRWDWVAAKRRTGDDTTQTDGAWRRVVVATQKLTSGPKPVPFSFKAGAAGSYVVDVIAQDGRGNRIEAGVDAYVTGPDYVPWDLPEGGSITLQSDKITYSPGDTARILVQSPWATSDALVTVERGEVRSARRVQLTGSASIVEVPVRDDDVPNVFVSVTLFKGRTAPPLAAQPEDPGRPQVRTGTVEVVVPPLARALNVVIAPQQKIARPATTARVQVRVSDADGRPAKGSEVTVWAVDEGVLRLTNYRSPNLLADLYPFKGLEVLTSDSRLRLLAISTDDKGDEAGFAPGAPEPGGGGGEEDAAADGVRQDFRILALWKGALTTDERGYAEVAFKLPESLTTYRLIAVASSGAERFGTGQSAIEVTKPFQVRPSLPRFVTPGDVVEAGAVLQNDTGSAGQATLSLQVPAGSPLRVEGATTRTLTLAPGATEVRFRLRADRTGTTAVTFQGQLGAERDGVRVSVPAVLPQRTETTAAAGLVEARSAPRGGTTSERLRLPAGVYPTAGGVSVGVSTSALAGLQNGIQELVEYPYGCLEQRSSRLRVLLMVNDMRTAFAIPQLAGPKLREAIDAEISRISDFETPDGGLAYWPGDDVPDVYLSARVLMTLVDANKLGIDVPNGLIDRVAGYLQGLVDNSANASGDDATSYLVYNRAHVLFALAHAGKAEKARIEALWADRKDLPVLERVHLLEAMGAVGITGQKLDSLTKELRNSVRVEADQAFLQEQRLGDYCPCLAYLFADEVHNSAAFLSAMLRVDPNDTLAPMVARWLLAQRRNGTWANTLENGYAVGALVDFYRAQEATTPALNAKVQIGSTTLTDRRFDGRSLETVVGSKTMQELLSAGIVAGQAVPLTITSTGNGRLYYTARLQYAPELRTLAALDQGITVERTYQGFAAGSRAATTFDAGDLVRVTLKVSSAQRRENVVIDDPLPAGLEALDARLSSTSQVDTAGTGADRYVGIDHTEIRDDRVLLFATSLPPGTFTYTYVARATSPGTYQVAPVQAQEMYRPEIFGRNAFTTLSVRVPGQAVAPGAEAPVSSGTASAPAARSG